ESDDKRLIERVLEEDGSGEYGADQCVHQQVEIAVRSQLLAVDRALENALDARVLGLEEAVEHEASQRGIGLEVGEHARNRGAGLGGGDLFDAPAEHRAEVLVDRA